MKLSVADHILVHGLEVLSRPPIIAEHRADLDMVVSILRDVLPRTSKGQAQLQPLIDLAARLVQAKPLRPGYYGSFHDEAASVLNRWDRARMAAAWDQFNGR